MKKIEFEAYDIKVNIQLRDYITILDDDTASGKTYLINIIDNIIKNPETAIVTGIPKDRFVVCKSEEEVNNILDSKPLSFIFVDRWDIYTKVRKRYLK